MKTNDAAPVRGTVRLEPAGLGARASAALLDMLVAAAVLTVTVWTWAFLTNPLATSDKPVPGYVTAIAVVLVCLYLTGTVVGGGTLGMRAAGLCVLRADNASVPGPARAAARSLVLVPVAWLLWQAHPLLVAGYLLLMLVIPKRRLPHDLLTGTVVSRARSGAATSAGAEAAAAVQQVPPSLEPGQARDLLADLDNLRRRSEGDLHRASVPMIVLGLLALGGAAVAVSGPMGDLSFVEWLFWVVAGPAGLAVTAWWYRRLRLRDGVGGGERDIVVIAVLVGCAALVSAFFLIGGAIAAAGFLAVAVTRRSRVLAAATVVFGLVVGFQRFVVLSNSLTKAYPNLPADLVEQYGTTVILSVLGMSLLLPGGLALRREQAR